ncbi:unnamed protein product [Candidula unifasciata]|uniref:Uncharacterized protein n=1 Tax=Candidula unifasciata TaxID=100452 RepID=A0A8S3YME1_9EUPU|nr:unnamed protein product [Candidula unifasciata]
MDWENKLYSIVKETQTNLAKAKDKLSGKSVPAIDYWTLNSSGQSGKHIQHHLNSLPESEVSNLDMNTDYSMQMFHLQEQIHSQNRRIEKLEKLVISLNNERDYYKEQISQLRGEVDHITDRMNSQISSISSERQIFTMKRELMNEIEKVKTMLHNYDKEAGNRKKTSISSTWNDDIWTIKENLTENIEQVHRELTAVNKRIGENASGASQYQRPSAVYTPGFVKTDDTSSLQLQQLRQTITALTSKLESLENKIDTANSQQPSVFSQNWPGNIQHIINRLTIHQMFILGDDNNDLHSLSDLSDFSSFSENNIDTLTFDLREGRTLGQQRRKPVASGCKYSTGKTGREEFSLSDSDIDDDDDPEIDSLDLC